MKSVLRFLSLVLLMSYGAVAQDFVGRWTGVADTVDEAGVKRQERHTLEIRSEDGKLTAVRIGRTGKGGPALQVQTDGEKIQLIEFIPTGGGEPLRWKLTLKDGSLVGTYQVLHDDPKKWVYDRTGPATYTRSEVPAGK
jgi:hypothetical protein